MVIEDLINFLNREPPFRFLDETTRKSVAGSVSLEFYPRETVILRQDGPASKSLRIIKKGAVKVLLKSEEGWETIRNE
jgi:CBS domain-containing protein